MRDEMKWCFLAVFEDHRYLGVGIISSGGGHCPRASDSDSDLAFGGRSARASRKEPARAQRSATSPDPCFQKR